jgi:cytosine/adenosine deaminase-related metal-dependent hydrolase
MEYVDSLSDYGKKLYTLSQSYGGWRNGHLHCDRSNTLASHYWNDANIDPFEAGTYSLAAKQNLTGELHKGPAYVAEDLYKRIKKELLREKALGTRSATSLIDATPDIGLIAIEAALQVKKELQGKLEFIVGTQPIFGFKNPEINSDRWDIFEKASRLDGIDVLGALPEKDDAPDKIGARKHLEMVLTLGIELGKEVHAHVDQGNDPRESGTELLIDCVKKIGSPAAQSDGQPTVWAVHAISTSCYDEYRFKTLLENLKKYNIGIICCPRAALSMRQLRPLEAPIHNSIVRLLELVTYEIPIRFGSDNVADIFIPTGNGNILDELILVADALRYYVPKLWAKLGCGEKLNDMDREFVARALYQENKYFRGMYGAFPRI